MSSKTFIRSVFVGGCLSLAGYHLPMALGQNSTSGTTSVVAMPGVERSDLSSTNRVPAHKRNPLLNYKFTNELGQPVRLSDFDGQALAITFFFTRCPMPDFCPRLSKNFQEASQMLCTNGAGFTNWHFLSVTFDPTFDTPEVLKAYGERYQYDPRHWNFVTGPKDKIDELARQSGITANPDNGLINHNFRTLIIDPSGHLQMVFPMGGDLSEAIVAEMRKAGAVTNFAAVRPEASIPPETTMPN